MYSWTGCGTQRDGVGMARSRARFLKALEQEIQGVQSPGPDSPFPKSVTAAWRVSDEP